VKKNILSALDQKYENYRIIYINDASTDKTLQILKSVIRNHPRERIVSVIDNKSNKGAMHNIYYTIHEFIEDGEIVCTLDGDDFFASPKVLSFLNEVYKQKNKKYWLTYGQYMGYQSRNRGHCDFFKTNTIKSNSFRNEKFLTSHLRTFYAWLFKNIKKEDLQYEGQFLDAAWDVAMMLPMIEMAANHFCFLNKILYLYNESNPISDFRVKYEKQQFLEKFIKAKPAYQPLD
jgi:glycosyltransferase involved in cell wall biosynthesis